MESNLDFLREFASESIYLRLKREIEPQNSAPEKLLEKIESEKNIKHIFENQNKNTSWLGTRFHGIEPGDQFSGAEIALRYLFEKGYTIQDKRVKWAVDALSKIPEIFPGFDIDSDDFSGYNNIRASLYIRAGAESLSSVNSAITKALTSFKNVFKYDDFESITEVFRKRYVFKEGLTWPGIYDLRILAHSQSWRTPDNLKLMVDSVTRLSEIVPMKAKIYLKIKDRFYSPGQAITDLVIPDINEELGNLDFWWFDRMELFARIGIIKDVQFLAEQLEKLKGILKKNSGIFKIKKMSSNFRTWSAYHGLSLEPCIRKKESKWSDYTFRCVLIEHYAKF